MQSITTKSKSISPPNYNYYNYKSRRKFKRKTRLKPSLTRLFNNLAILQLHNTQIVSCLQLNHSCNHDICQTDSGYNLGQQNTTRKKCSNKENQQKRNFTVDSRKSYFEFSNSSCYSNCCLAFQNAAPHLLFTFISDTRHVKNPSVTTKTKRTVKTLILAQIQTKTIHLKINANLIVKYIQKVRPRNSQKKTITTITHESPNIQQLLHSKNTTVEDFYLTSHCNNTCHFKDEINKKKVIPRENFHANISSIGVGRMYKILNVIIHSWIDNFLYS